MYAQKAIVHNAPTLHTVRNVHNAHCAYRFKVQSCDCINFVRAIDPCSGSGHILAYMFDVLMKIYESYGYTSREAVGSIVENNLYGLDIDERAAQLAYFAVMMKARQYDRRFFNRKDEDGNLCIPQPHVYAIAESNHVDSFAAEYFCNGDAALKEAMDTIIQELHDAKEYGSILTVTPQDWKKLYARFDEIKEDIHMYRDVAVKELLPLVQVAEALGQKYDAVVTNPPYMGASNMNQKLNEFIKNKYADYKSDFFSAFVVHASEMSKYNGYCGFFTPYVWMFLQSYEKLRQYLYGRATIETLIQFEYSAFEEATVPVCSFVFSNKHVRNKKGNYLRLVDFRGGMEIQRQKTLEAINNHNCGFYYEQTTDKFAKIPSHPVAFWLSDSFLKIFDTGTPLGGIADSKQGLATADNNRFVREWYEVEYSKIHFSAKNIEESKKSKKKWFPYNKGGEYRKWYGNNDFVVNWENDGYEIRNFVDDKGKLRSRPQNTAFYFKESGSWSDITSSTNAFRYKPEGNLFDITGMSFFSEKYLFYLIGLCNTKIGTEVLKVVAPTIHCQCGDVANIPVIYIKDMENKVVELVKESVRLSDIDWDLYETSWDFKQHPMLPRLKAGSETVFIDKDGRAGSVTVSHCLMAHCYDSWKADCESRFLQLKANEEELNRIFIDIYGLQDELTPEVADKDVTVHRIYDTKDDVPESMKGSNYVRTMRDEIVSLISYAVGCMFGRYSLDTEGLAYAGGDWDASKYSTFIPDKDAIIPICDDEYFEDDIVGLFVKFVKTVYGEDTLEENLKFIADALGGKGTSRDVIRKYFMDEFYKDHCKTYQKRPIYWLFDSGKKNGFKCLIYMHRYQPDTIARIRTDYVHEQQSRYRTAIVNLESRVNEAGTS